MFNADRTARILWWIAAALTAVIVALLLVKVLTWDWMAVGDFGTLRLRTLDVGGSHTPLVGIYSRWGWNHPGPMLFLFMAPALRLTGGAGHGLLLGALLINLGAVAGTLAVIRRSGRERSALLALSLIVLVRVIGSGELLDPWNPYVLIVPMFAATIAAWRAVLGERMAAIVFAVAASFAVQSHVEVGLTVGLLTLAVFVALAVRAWRGPQVGRDRRTLAITVGVGLVCWILPIWQQLTSSTGNLRAILSFALHGEGPVNGWSDGARIVSWFVGQPWNWVAGDLLVPKPHLSVPIAHVARLAASLWAWRRSMRSELVLCGVAWLVTICALITSSRISGLALPYLYRWVVIVGVLVWVAVGAVVLHELRERVTWSRWNEVVLLGATVILLALTLVQGPNVKAIEGSDHALRKFSSLVEPTLDALRDAPPPTLLTVTADGVDGSFAIDLLQRAPDDGFDVRFRPDLAYVFGTQRTIDPSDARSELVLAAGPSRDMYLADPRYRLVAQYDPLSPEGRAEYERLDAIDWNARPDGPARPGTEYRRYRKLAEDFEYLAVFISDEPPVVRP